MVHTFFTGTERRGRKKAAAQRDTTLFRSQTPADGAFDLPFVDPPLDLLVARGIDGAHVLHRYGTAGAVVVGDLAGNRDVPVDYQENIFAGLRVKAKTQTAEQHEAHSLDGSRLEPGRGAGGSVYDRETFRTFANPVLSDPHRPDPLL